MIRLEPALASFPWLGQVLDALPALDLPQAHVAAGAIAQTVWNHATGRPPGHGIADLDIVYFDPADLSAEAEQAADARARAAFPALPLRLDVKNQARVHLWYQRRFGRAIDPYRSIAAAVATYPTTATAIAVRREEGRLAGHAPFGLDDLLALTIRPNHRLVTEAVYRAKAARWQALWPELRVLPWENGVVPA
ncbi:hypothetical protein STVA_36080 [Allostella vacuolata]|nr:hypothetical protein STVA_36080 [Stella vacuolata]